jgi:hypothetical protein
MPVELKVPGSVNFFSYFCINAISQRKPTKRNCPRPGELRAALRFSQPACPLAFLTSGRHKIGIDSGIKKV